MSGGTEANTALAINGYPTLQALIANDNFNLTTSIDAFAEVVGKAKLGYPLT